MARTAVRATISMPWKNVPQVPPYIPPENISSLRSFVDNLHNNVRTLKTYGHGADLQAAANMQQIVSKQPPKIALRWSRQK